MFVEATTSEIKAIARRVLKGNWGKIFGVLVGLSFLNALVPEIINYIFPNFTIIPDYVNDMINIKVQSNVPLNAAVINNSVNNLYWNNWLYLIYAIFILIPLQLGTINFIYRFVRKNEFKIKNLFFGFEHLLSSFLIPIITSVLVAIPVILALAIGVVVGLIFRDAGAFAFLITFIPIVVGCVFSVILTLGLYMAYYIKCRSPQMSAWACIKESWTLMRDNKTRLFALFITFLGWLILAAIVTAIIIKFLGNFASSSLLYNIFAWFAAFPSILVNVYMQVAVTVFFLFSIGKIREKKATINDNGVTIYQEVVNQKNDTFIDEDEESIDDHKNLEQ